MGRYSTIFHLITDIFKKADITCVLIGGFAVNYYKATRHTADVDFLITEENFAKILPLFIKEGYRQTAMEKLFTRLEDNDERQMPIDFMFIDKEVLNSIIKDGKGIEVADQKFIVPSLYHLIALKLHSIKNNPKPRLLTDLPDIINLINFNNIDVKNNEFKKLCFKYGTEELYKKILDYYI